MLRESTYACTYSLGEQELVAHVRAWDDREAAELFAREIEMDSDGRAIRPTDVRVRPLSADRSELASGG